jgi:hypothetical protein
MLPEEGVTVSQRAGGVMRAARPFAMNVLLL